MYNHNYLCASSQYVVHSDRVVRLALLSGVNLLSQAIFPYLQPAAEVVTWKASQDAPLIIFYHFQVYTFLGLFAVLFIA